MLLVDTNILAYYFLDGTQSSAVRELAARDPDWHSERFLLIEFTNVLARHLSANNLTLGNAQEILGRVRQKMHNSLHTVPHQDVLVACTQLKVSAYDARFLVLAQHLGLKLITEDKKLRAAAPHLTQSLDEALATTA